MVGRRCCTAWEVWKSIDAETRQLSLTIFGEIRLARLHFISARQPSLL